MIYLCNSNKIRVYISGYLYTLKPLRQPLGCQRLGDAIRIQRLLQGGELQLLQGRLGRGLAGLAGPGGDDLKRALGQMDHGLPQPGTAGHAPQAKEDGDHGGSDQCARKMAETAEAVFLLLVRQEAYGAAWRTLQKHGVCVMTWPMEQAVLTQTLRNLLLLKKSMQTMQAQTDQLRSQLQDLKRIQKAKGLLMRQLGMTEQDAHRWIEKAAMDRCVKKREIAETIIRMYEL